MTLILQDHIITREETQQKHEQRTKTNKKNATSTASEEKQTQKKKSCHTSERHSTSPNMRDQLVEASDR
jgi:hypothetical protein